MKLVIIRHGKTPANEEARYIGRTDQPLSEKGKEELRGIYPECLKTDHLFVSPMKRCVETAQIVFGDMEQIIINDWKEMDFGDFEMKNYLELNGNADYQAWIDSGGEMDFPGGEPKADFSKRVVNGFNQFIEICRKERIEEAAAVVHGGTIMALFSSITDGDYFSFQVKNGQGFEVEIDLEKAAVLSCRRLNCQ